VFPALTWLQANERHYKSELALAWFIAWFQGYLWRVVPLTGTADSNGRLSTLPVNGKGGLVEIDTSCVSRCCICTLEHDLSPTGSWPPQSDASGPNRQAVCQVPRTPGGMFALSSARVRGLESLDVDRVRFVKTRVSSGWANGLACQPGLKGFGRPLAFLSYLSS